MGEEPSPARREGPIISKEGNDFGKAVSRILSAPCGGENHLSQQPIPGTRSLSRTAAGRCGVPYLALHPMGFSVPRRLRFERCALTAPFHPYLSRYRGTGGLFSVALSVNAPLGGVARVYLHSEERSYAASRPDGVRTFLLPLARKAILRLPKIAAKVSAVGISSKSFGKDIPNPIRIPVRNPSL